MIGATNVHASIILVENTLNSGAGSLRDAITSASDFDTILIDIKGTITLDSQIDIIGKSDLTIIGPYPKHNTITPSSGWSGSLFNINSCARLVIRGLSFSESFGTTRHVSVSACPDFIFFRACLFENGNFSSGNGGSIHNDGSIVAFEQCSFINNAAINGGAISALGVSTTQLINCTFSENFATDKAGAINLAGNAEVNSYYCTYVYNNSTNAPTTFSGLGGTALRLENNAIGENGTARQINILGGAPTTYGGNRIKLNYLGEPTGIPILIVGDLFSNLLIMGLRTTLLEDGYGLKYWPIVSSTSQLINPAIGTVRTPVLDCRNAPRSLKGTSALNVYPDAGAAEYTHLRVTNSSGDKAVANSYLWTLEAAQRKENVHFIEFDIPSPTAINPLSEGAAAVEAYIIDGFTQPGSSVPGPQEIGFPGLTPAILPIQLVNTGAIDDGIQFNVSTNGSKVKGISIQNFNKHGIELFAGDIEIIGCEIGIDDAESENGNKDAGIKVRYDNTIIGGWQHYQRNVISGNGQSGGTENANIFIFSGEYVRITGNIIGLNPSGLNILGTPDQTEIGIYSNSSFTQIGGLLKNEKNVIGDNAYGIFLNLAGDFSIIQNNHIGVAWDGTTAVDNAECGVFLSGSDQALIGGYNDQSANRIAHNGIGIVLRYNTTPALDNRILGNSIYLNDNQGIDLAFNNIVVPNDGLEISSEDNYGLDYPELTEASNCDLSETIITYDLSVPTGINYRVEFFSNSSPDPTNGEGETFLGFQTVTPATNPQSFTFNVGSLLPPGTSVTATVTSEANNSTSEFGINVVVSEGNAGTINYDDVCFGNAATPTITGDLGGIFSYDGGDPADGSILDPATGVLTNGLEGTTYSIVYEFGDGCGNNDTTTVTIIEIDESFVMDDFCPGSSGTAVPTLPGGVFSFNPAPLDGATLTSDTGIHSGGVEGATYTIQYIATDGTCSDTGTIDVSVIATDASFTMADFCPIVISPAAIPAEPGGVFGFAVPPGDGATINATTGAITGGIEGATYSIKHTVGACLKDFTLSVNVISTDESFSYSDFCPGDLGAPFGIAEPGGTFYFEVDDDPAIINGATGILSGGVEGTTYSIIYEVGTCSDRDTVDVTVLTVPQEFTFANFCVVDDSSGTGPVAVDPAIANYILLGPADGASINPTSGIVYNPIEGTTYTVVDSASTGTCWQADTVLVTAVEVNENFVIDDICFGETASPTVEEILVDTFFFSIDPIFPDPVLIDGLTGDVTLGLANTTYTVRRISYVGTCADSAEATFTVNQPNASFIFDDFCPTDLSPEPLVEVDGGIFTLEFLGGFGESIDDITGAISGPQEDSSYSVIYTLLVDGCENADTNIVHVINVPEEFEFDDFCWESGSAPGIPTMGGGEWSFAMPLPLDGAIIDPLDGTITLATEGTEYAVEYSLTVGSCTQEDSMIVIAIGVDESFIFPDICPLVASAPPVPSAIGGTYSFSPGDPGDGAEINASTGVITNGLEGATYAVEYIVFDPSGLCSESSIETLSVISIDESFSTTDFCAELVSEIIVPVTAGGTFSFAPDLGDGATIDPLTGAISSAIAGTNYPIQYIVSDGFCTETDTNFIFARLAYDPGFTLEDHCANLDVLAIITGEPGGTFDFDPTPADGATIDPSTGLISNGSGNTYNVRYIILGDTDVCSDSLTISVTLFPTPEIISLESDVDLYCPDDLLGSIQVTEEIDAFKVYWYEDSEGAVILDSTFNYLPTELMVGNNTFYAQAISAEGCLSEIKSYNLFLSDTSGMRAGQDQSICLGSPAQLEAFGGDTYLWDTEVPLGDYTLGNPVAFSLNEESYAVRITNGDNCDVFDTIQVFFNPQNECDIELYNAFSPNDDGKNDIWYIENLINYLPNTVYIYTRWGDELLSIENYDNINAYWDGTDGKGRALMPGTYFYVVITEIPENNQAGWVQLVR